MIVNEKIKLQTIALTSLGIIIAFAADTAVQKGLDLMNASQRDKFIWYACYVVVLLVIFLIWGRKFLKLHPEVEV
jgi:membrane protease YdiL (CAAX protease family)